MESRQKKRLGDMLIEEQIITDEQLSDALEKKKGTTKRLGEVLVELGYTNETDIGIMEQMVIMKQLKIL